MRRLERLQRHIARAGSDPGAAAAKIIVDLGEVWAWLLLDRAAIDSALRTSEAGVGLPPFLRDRVQSWREGTAAALSLGAGSVRVVCAWKEMPQGSAGLLLPGFLLPLRWSRIEAGARPSHRVLPDLAEEVKDAVAKAYKKDVASFELNVEERLPSGASLDELAPSSFDARSAFVPLAAGLALAVLGGTPRDDILCTGDFDGERVRAVESIEAKSRVAGAFGGRTLFVPKDNVGSGTRVIDGVELKALDPAIGLKNALTPLLDILDVRPSKDDSFEKRRDYFLRHKASVPQDEICRFHRTHLFEDIVARCRARLGPELRRPCPRFIHALGDHWESAALAALMFATFEPDERRLIVSTKELAERSKGKSGFVAIVNAFLEEVGLPAIEGDEVIAGPERRGVDYGDLRQLRAAFASAAEGVPGEGLSLSDTTGGSKLCTIAALGTLRQGLHAVYLSHAHQSREGVRGPMPGEEQPILVDLSRAVSPSSGRRYVLNSPVMTGFGAFTFEGPVSVDDARRWLPESFTSAIGHAPTASLLSRLLGRTVPHCRVLAKLEPGDEALVFRLLDRLPEGKVLGEEELSSVAYEFGIVKRLE